MIVDATLTPARIILELERFDPPQESTSGKTLLVASSGRTARTSAKIDGKVVYVNCHCFVYPDSGEDDA